MELIKKVNAYMALSAISKEKFSYRDAFEIFSLKEELRESFEFFREKERELVEGVAKKDDKGTVIRSSDGYFDFSGENAAAEYHKSMNDLASLETESVKVIRISPPSRISPDTLEALSGFVEFKEGCD